MLDAYVLAVDIGVLATKVAAVVAGDLRTAIFPTRIAIGLRDISETESRPCMLQAGGTVLRVGDVAGRDNFVGPEFPRMSTADASIKHLIAASADRMGVKSAEILLVSITNDTLLPSAKAGLAGGFSTIGFGAKGRYSFSASRVGLVDPIDALIGNRVLSTAGNYAASAKQAEEGGLAVIDCGALALRFGAIGGAVATIEREVVPLQMAVEKRFVELVTTQTKRAVSGVWEAMRPTVSGPSKFEQYVPMARALEMPEKLAAINDWLRARRPASIVASGGAAAYFQSAMKSEFYSDIKIAQHSELSIVRGLVRMGMQHIKRG